MGEVISFRNGDKEEGLLVLRARNGREAKLIREGFQLHLLGGSVGKMVNREPILGLENVERGER